MLFRFILMILLCQIAYAQDERQVSRIYTRLTGKTLNPKSPLFEKLKTLAAQNQVSAAAQLIISEDPDFIDVTSKDFATRMLSIDADAYGVFSDMIATVMGTIRDDIDARELLTGDYVYGPTGRVSGGLKPSLTTNELYDKFSRGNFSSKTYIQKFSPQWNHSTVHSAAGVLTTRGWAKVYYEAGTNRRAVVGVFNAFLCSPIDEWKKRGLPDYRVRRDIDRAPEGKPSTFQNTCRTCHAPMDAMAGAFSRLDYKNENFVFSPVVVPKYNQNINVYPDGFISDDDSWLNLLNGTQGDGVKAFGQMIASDEGFPACMAQRVVKQVCFKDLKPSEAFIKNMAQQFELSGYKLKELFKQVVLSEDCYL
jgi:hypothetical protein